MSQERCRLLFPAALAWLLAAALGTVASAQSVIDIHEDLDFDRPEAWAMKYFSAATLFSSLGVPERLPVGSIELGVEGGWLPSLSEEERRVGFYGSKVEDLNKTSVFGRPRLVVGLPAAFTLTLGWVPPIEVGGTTPNLVSLALGRPLASGRSWRLGARLFGQGGEIEADITCDRDSVEAGNDPVQNPFRCEEPSEDQVTLRYVGLDLGASFVAGAKGKLEPYGSVAVAFLDPEFQVDARYNGLIDHTLQTTNGTIYSFALGARYAASEKWRLAAEAFYVPLTLVRRPEGDKESQDFFNLRVLVTYRVR